MHCFALIVGKRLAFRSAARHRVPGHPTAEQASCAGAGALRIFVPQGEPSAVGNFGEVIDMAGAPREDMCAAAADRGRGRF